MRRGRDGGRGEGTRERIGREKGAVPSKGMDADTSKGQAEWRAGGQGTQERDARTARGGKGGREPSTRAGRHAEHSALRPGNTGRPALRRQGGKD